MAASAVLTPAQPLVQNNVVNGRTYDLPLNPNVNNSAYKHFEEYEKTTNGAYRFIQLLAKVASAVAMYFEYIGDACASLFSGIAQKLTLVWGLMGIARLATVSRQCYEVVTTTGTPEWPEVHSLRDPIHRMHDVTDCAAMWLYTGASLLSSASLRNTAEMFSVVSDVTSGIEAGEDLATADRLIAHIDVNNTALIQRFQETKTEALLRLCKEIASVTGAVLGFLAIATGSAALLAISIASTVFAMAAHFYKETAQYRPIKFYEWTVPAPAEGIRT